jgi:uncharacterized protein YqjF (DUF2071 family)
MRTGPQPGDLLIHNTLNECFEILDADGHHVAGPFESFVAARFRALIESKGGAVWQQAFDVDGLALGDPVVVPPLR